MRRVIIILSLLWLVIFMPAFAMTVRGLNTVIIPVDNQSEQALQKSLPQAALAALVKLSGNPGVTTLPQIESDMANVQEFVQSYSYLTQTDSQGKEQTFAKVTFDQKALIQLLRQAGQAVWTANRPLVLAWINTGIAPSSTILSSTSNNDLMMTLENTAKARGLPMILPDMDLQDQAFINADMNKNFDIQKLKAAENRYDVNIILAGNINPGINNVWQGQWFLLFYGQPFQWDNTGNDANALIAKAIDNTANILANQLATLNTKNLETQVRIEVMGVNGISDYVKVLKYLKTLSSVSSVAVYTMDSQSLILDITTVGGSEKLMAALQGNPHFLGVGNPGGQNHRSVDLYYQWKATG